MSKYSSNKPVITVNTWSLRLRSVNWVIKIDLRSHASFKKKFALNLLDISINIFFLSFCTKGYAPLTPFISLLPTPLYLCYQGEKVKEPLLTFYIHITIARYCHCFVLNILYLSGYNTMIYFLTFRSTHPTINSLYTQCPNNYISNTMFWDYAHTVLRTNIGPSEWV